MQYGICNLSMVSLRSEPTNDSPLISQVLYGEYFKVLEQRKFWSKIRLAFDGNEGWIDNKQYLNITEENYKFINNKNATFSQDLVEFVQDPNEQLYAIPLGSTLNGLEVLNHRFDGTSFFGVSTKCNLVKTAFIYLNTPYLSGGKTPFGIDSSGFTQMVYKLNGYKLLRTASQQATQGEALSFIEESEPGDLAFFDDDEGVINHVGIIMKDNYIIHAYGKVRIDRLDHSGIFNVDEEKHTHKLRVIKKVI
ncbi:hydrolase Nlp/P60 [Oceanihabitans sp. IOP_32]|uniref:C40 family peptidase n=1 Tax=Oceanihabitans sp. IOP_32 TaxID=2529032 RepID=UPI001293C923|nr:C40 family peptidase [Oceanihabitans sp. IOP_32]QFZ55498.1 hydrolase Nlp/P60 [Oceanihabitans sp. IOP_32]